MNMNKRSLALIMATAVLVLCLLSPFAGAVTICYTADSGGESVSINENYDIDNTVTVKESTEISFGNLQVDQERTAEGTGEADLKQTISGKSVDSAGYVAENDILSEGTIDAKTHTSATGNSLGVAQTVSATGDAELCLDGEEGGNIAANAVAVNNGRLNSKQTLDIGNSVRASLDASIDGFFGAAVSMAEDVDGNCAETVVGVIEGELSTSQAAEAGGSATAAEKSRANGTSCILMTGAENQYGETYIRNTVVDGTLDSESEAIANEDEAFCSQDMSAEGSYIHYFVEADNFAGPSANVTTVVVWAGTLTTITTATVKVTSAMINETLVINGTIDFSSDNGIILFPHHTSEKILKENFRRTKWPIP
jgi:hypothetical protein